MSKEILFLHPDLGIGGAERLVVDAALSLISKGHRVSFVTTHHDPAHCFTETKDGSFEVTVVGDWIPRNIFGKFFALFAYLRMLYAALYVVWFSNLHPDVIFCDIVSACIPVLQFGKNRVPVVYYCHFPDQLLSKPGNKLKDAYRAPLNWIEEKTTNSADVILVNSKFTRCIFKKTFTSINKVPEILYPSLNTEFFNQPNFSNLGDVLETEVPSDSFVFLSINRYERKKNIALAIAALGLLKVKVSENEWKRVLLIIAGGFDNRVRENIEHYEELKEKAILCNVQDKVHFLKSPSDLVKLSLLKQCDCVIYTPPNEHFGIVPLEAMYSQKPVIAVNSGGPTETIVNGETGFLCNPKKEEFSCAMAECIKNGDLIRKMGLAGRKRFDENFSFDAFTGRLNTIINNLIVKEKKHS